MAEASGKRDRSPAFPQVPLGESVDRLVAFEKYFGRHPAPLKTAGAAWNLKQFGDILAALKHFGFIDYAGPSNNRTVAITDDGRNLLRAQQDSVRRGIIQKAALKPKEIAKFWADWGSDRPPDPVCLDTLVLRSGYSQRGAPLFLRSYDATIAFAGLGQADKIATDSAEVQNDPDEVEAENPPPLRPQPVVRSPLPAVREVGMMDGERVVFTEEGEPNQYLKLVASGPIDDGLLEALEDFVKRQRRRLTTPLVPPHARAGGPIPRSLMNSDPQDEGGGC